MADEYYSFLMCNYDVSKYHEGYYKLEIDDLFMYTEFISSKEKCYFNKLKEQQKWYILNYKEKK
ncbi:hypothetical protein [Brachyspira sp.]|uniref:hypothetical protein n=1 Tax=Brachyspira sp. TaxID=1977261 RepID=UPI0026141305|nr:hypothetical protein [Brachyspira sp.]